MGILDGIFQIPEETSSGAITVTELNEYIKAKIDADGFLSHVTLKGEISNFTNH